MKCCFLFIFFGLMASSALAQQNNNEAMLIETDSVSSDWSFNAGVYYYIFPEDDNTGMFISYADYKAWHMEVRYNYEDEKSGSAFGGYRFETGEAVVFGATPMIGLVFGNTNGIAPGLEMDLTWKKFDFYSESEYVFDFETAENNFFYTWSELAISPCENFRAGLSANRTRLFESDLDFERGVFAQYSFWKLTAGVYYYNPLSSDYYILTSLEIEF